MALEWLGKAVKDVVNFVKDNREIVDAVKDGVQTLASGGGAPTQQAAPQSSYGTNGRLRNPDGTEATSTSTDTNGTAGTAATTNTNKENMFTQFIKWIVELFTGHKFDAPTTTNADGTTTSNKKSGAGAAEKELTDAFALADNPDSQSLSDQAKEALKYAYSNGLDTKERQAFAALKQAVKDAAKDDGIDVDGTEGEKIKKAIQDLNVASGKERDPKIVAAEKTDDKELTDLFAKAINSEAKEFADKAKAALKYAYENGLDTKEQQAVVALKKAVGDSVADGSICDTEDGAKITNAIAALNKASGYKGAAR